MADAKKVGAVEILSGLNSVAQKVKPVKGFDEVLEKELGNIEKGAVKEIESKAKKITFGGFHPNIVFEAEEEKK